MRSEQPSTCSKRGYQLECATCHRMFEDDGTTLACNVKHESGLLRTRYLAASAVLDSKLSGIFRYRSWLPIARSLPVSYGPICYAPKKLRRSLGTPNLLVAFSGFWPERGAVLPTATFKDLEAITVLSRISSGDSRILVVASTGNAAAAFANVCTLYDQRCLLVVPDRGLRHLKLFRHLAPCVKLLALRGATYDEAIVTAQHICSSAAFISEGGVRNVARRDGIGTTLLAARTYQRSSRLLLSSNWKWNGRDCCP